MNLTVFNKEIEALRAHILEECKRQGFTVNDFEQLVIRLKMDLEERQYWRTRHECVVIDVIARPSWGEADPLRSVGDWLEIFEENSREIYNCVGKTSKELEEFINNCMKEWAKVQGRSYGLSGLRRSPELISNT